MIQPRPTALVHGLARWIDWARFCPGLPVSKASTRVRERKHRSNRTKVSTWVGSPGRVASGRRRLRSAPQGSRDDHPLENRTETITRHRSQRSPPDRRHHRSRRQADTPTGCPRRCAQRIGRCRDRCSRRRRCTTLRRPLLRQRRQSGCCHRTRRSHHLRSDKSSCRPHTPGSRNHRYRDRCSRHRRCRPLRNPTHRRRGRLRCSSPTRG